MDLRPHYSISRTHCGVWPKARHFMLGRQVHAAMVRLGQKSGVANAHTKQESLVRSLQQFLGILAFFACATSLAQEGTFTSRSLTTETALAAASAALQSCRKQGYQVAVAVVDRAGLTQALLRDRFAGAHTIEVAANKAWTAASFRTSTTDIARETQPGMPMSGLRTLPRFLAAGGGLVIEAGGSTLGAIGVSGAPRGEADDSCAKAGIDAIRDSIEF